ncbi:endonuclease domain-containing protein [Nocardia sp. NPDC058705]|uniref:endonuclease domain-containing protein n=1 Tax=Nocardia sp. NPDC058705 TaxID=3346609 RepID=UPI00367E2D79
MGWKQWRVAVEYDGAQHWTDPKQRTKDIDRHAALTEHGWHIIRVSADLLHNRPHTLLTRVHTALTSRGARLDGRSPCHGASIGREPTSTKTW